MKSIVTIRVNSQLKQKAEEILNDFGMTLSQAVSLFFEEVVLQKDLPFPLSIPNAETLQAMKDVANHDHIATFETADALFADLES